MPSILSANGLKFIAWSFALNGMSPPLETCKFNWFYVFMYAYANKNRQPEGHTVGCMARQVHEAEVDVTLSYMPLGCPQWPNQEKNTPCCTATESLIMKCSVLTSGSKTGPWFRELPPQVWVSLAWLGGSLSCCSRGPFDLTADRANLHGKRLPHPSSHLRPHGRVQVGRQEHCQHVCKILAKCCCQRSSRNRALCAAIPMAFRTALEQLLGAKWGCPRQKG